MKINFNELLNNLEVEKSELELKYANIILNEAIKPFCLKYGFDFICGNGTYFFKKVGEIKVPNSWLDRGYLETYTPANKEVRQLLKTIDLFFNEIHLYIPNFENQ